MRLAYNKNYKHLVKPSVFLLLAVILLLPACSSTWKAPVSSYSTPPKPAAKIVTSTAPRNSKHNPIRISKRGFYRVKKGDTLYGIAWQTGADYKQLAEWNGISYPYTIFDGQQLRTTAPKKTPAHSKPKAVKPAPATVSRKTPPAEFRGKAKLSWMWPTQGKVIQGFKYRDDTKKGIKLEGENGQKIVAAESGKVVYSGSGLIGYGKLIIIKHNNTYLSAYGHNKSLLVTEGDQVTKGMQIAKMGLLDDGRPALHFEIRKNGKPLNPVAVLPTKKQ